MLTVSDIYRPLGLIKSVLNNMTQVLHTEFLSSLNVHLEVNVSVSSG